jgi:hypothetical protein
MNLSEQLAIQAMYDAQANQNEPEAEELKPMPKRRGRQRKGA